MAEEATDGQHFYGGQAVVEGVMMRGRDVWAIAVRRPDATIHVESHDIDSLVARHPIFRQPGLRGVIALGQALSIGFKALSISARESSPEEERLSSRQMAVSMTIAGVIFATLLIPAVGSVAGTRHDLNKTQHKLRKLHARTLRNSATSKR